MYPKEQTRSKGPFWGPEGVMRGGSARGKSKKIDFILKKFKENAGRMVKNALIIREIAASCFLGAKIAVCAFL